MAETVSHLRRAVRAFAQREVAPVAAKLDGQNSFPAVLWNRLGQAGLLGITVPPNYGGRGLSYLHHLVCMEEISRVSPAVGLSYAAHSNLCLDNLYRNGNERQRRRYLPVLCTGEKVGALAISEPEAGSDIVGSMRCHAEQRDGVWLANGTKKWITNGPAADIFLVYMRTRKPEVGSRSISAFIVERNIAGFHTGPRTDKLGMRGSDTCELTFEHCRIPPENLLGQPHGGVPILMRGLDSERLVLVGGPIGIMQAALDAVLPYVRTRKQFGQPIGSFQLVQAKLADMYTRLEAARGFAYRVAEGFENNPHARRDAAACLLFASESGVACALEAIQALGARGYMNDSPTSRLLRDAKLYDIGAGTNEIRRMLIGRELFREGKIADVRRAS